ncbi:UNVERIFIED_CONTAM: hypothetical protein FKN15_028300 [Acipenser sinensis]
MENEGHPVKSEEDLVDSEEDLVDSGEDIVENEGHLVDSNEDLVENEEHPVKSEEDLVDSGEDIVENEGHLVDSKEDLMENEGHPVKSEEDLVDSGEDIVENEGHLVDSKEDLMENEGHPVKSEEDLVDSGEDIVENEGHLVDSKEDLMENEGHPVKSEEDLVDIEEDLVDSGVDIVENEGHLVDSKEDLVEKKDFMWAVKDMPVLVLHQRMDMWFVLTVNQILMTPKHASQKIPIMRKKRAMSWIATMQPPVSLGCRACNVQGGLLAIAREGQLPSPGYASSPPLGGACLSSPGAVLCPAAAVAQLEILRPEPKRREPPATEKGGEMRSPPPLKVLSLPEDAGPLLLPDCSALRAGLPLPEPWPGDACMSPPRDACMSPPEGRLLLNPGDLLWPLVEYPTPLSAFLMPALPLAAFLLPSVPQEALTVTTLPPMGPVMPPSLAKDPVKTFGLLREEVAFEAMCAAHKGGDM